jgi:mono/diheme cytochrome c family protein
MSEALPKAEEQDKVADTPESSAIVKKETETPERDPIVSRSTSAAMLISTLLLIATLAWALYDEAYGQRPWKRAQQEFVERYNRYLRSIKNQAGQTEREVKESAEYQQLDEEARAARAEIEPRKKEIEREIKAIDEKIAAVTDPFQNARGQITVINYQIETAGSDSSRERLRQKAAQKKQERITVYLPDGAGKTTRAEYNYTELEKIYNDLKAEKARLLAENGELLKGPTELAKKRDEYLKDHMIGLTPSQIDALIRKNENFDYSLKQISVTSDNIVDRCETCHLGVREPLTLKASDLAPEGPGKKPDEWARAFVSHPSKELLTIHNPDRFGCSGCHGGNGRATTSVVKGHGRHRFWLHPLYEKENMQAGCQQCHTTDRVLQGAPQLTLGKDLFQNRGCVGCHRSEGFDRETDALATTRQQIIQLEENIRANDREARQAREAIANAADDAEAQLLSARSQSLVVSNSLLAAEIDQLNIQARYLMQDQKKVGPNLKDVRLKLVKEWIPEWLRDPQTFRPGTKMPTFWRLNAEMSHDPRADDDRKAIAAYLWQESFDGRMPGQDRTRGNTANGKQLFETIGCMACHSIGEGDAQVGGDFAANLQRVGEKANFDYIVRWIYNPRIRWAPYCPKEKRDITREEYRAKNLAYIFDTEQFSKCPNDGAELQVQNMTVMPNFRLTIDQARDIASYLFSLSQGGSFRDATASSYMDDPALKERGREKIKQYGCAGCHEIKGFEDEQRIGKDLTAEGSTPIERLDFALLTHKAEQGIDPETGKEGKVWYNHKGFFENKLESPWIYDKGKEKEPQDRLRMPEPYLTPEWKTALTTFLLGSVGSEGANVPESLFYRPDDQRKAVQDGWWVIKKYNCMGCHSIQVGQSSTLMNLPLYQNPDWKEQLPPNLTSEGARVDPNWLLRFLHDPSLTDERGQGEPGRSDKPLGVTQPAGSAIDNQATRPAGASANGTQPGEQTVNPGPSQPANQIGGTAIGPVGITDSQLQAEQFRSQPGADRNGIRPYLRARMPTFNFSPNELRILVRFFMAVSAQQEPYIREPLEPLREDEKMLARALFTSEGAPCLKCHITGDPAHDRTASAPNFLLASERLKPKWTYRWLLDPQQISPGTAMPSGLFKKEGERMVFNGPTPEAFNNYHRDHAELLVRYMFLLTPDEQRRLSATSPAATGGSSPAPTAPAPQPSSAHARRVKSSARRLNSHAWRSVHTSGKGRGQARAPNASMRRARLRP